MDAAIGMITRREFSEAVRACREVFTRYGFEILHESDLTDTFASPDTAGGRADRVVVLGVTPSGFAGRAYAINKDVALLIPKNIVIRESTRGCVIQALNPELLAPVVSGGLQDLAEDMAAQLREIMSELAL